MSAMLVLFTLISNPNLFVCTEDNKCVVVDEMVHIPNSETVTIESDKRIKKYNLKDVIFFDGTKMYTVDPDGTRNVIYNM